MLSRLKAVKESVMLADGMPFLFILVYFIHFNNVIVTDVDVTKIRCCYFILFKNLRDSCMEDLKELINDELYEKYHEFIKKIREHRHKTIQEREIRKFNQLFQQNKGGCSKHPDGCSNHHTTTVAQKFTKHDQTTTEVTTRQKWVKNLLGVPLTKAQTSLLTCRPNFAVAPRHPLWGLHSGCRTSLP